MGDCSPCPTGTAGSSERWPEGTNSRTSNWPNSRRASAIGRSRSAMLSDLANSVTAAIVSARQRTIDASSGQDFLQIDAPINKGDSGGPTFDTNGDVITSLGGAPVRDAGELTRKVHAAAPDSSVRLDTLKRGKSSPVNVTLSQLPNSPQAAVPERQFRRALGDDPNSVLDVDHDLAVRRLGFRPPHVHRRCLPTQSGADPGEGAAFRFRRDA